MIWWSKQFHDQVRNIHDTSCRHRRRCLWQIEGIAQLEETESWWCHRSKSRWMHLDPFRHPRASPYLGASPHWANLWRYYTSNKKLLRAPGIATRSKDATTLGQFVAQVFGYCGTDRHPWRPNLLAPRCTWHAPDMILLHQASERGPLTIEKGARKVLKLAFSRWIVLKRVPSLPPGMPMQDLNCKPFCSGCGRSRAPSGPWKVFKKCDTKYPWEADQHRHERIDLWSLRAFHQSTADPRLPSVRCQTVRRWDSQTTNHKLLVTRASLLVTSALLLVASSY